MRNNNRSVWIIAIWSFAAILILPMISSFATVQSDGRSNVNSECEDACDDAYAEDQRTCDKDWESCEKFCRSSSNYYACMVSCDTQYDNCTSYASWAWASCLASCGD